MVWCWSRAWLQGLFLACLLGTVRASASEALVDYQEQIQPLFDRYCVACHACFDAPCQLDLTHAAGVKRGASKQPVYDAARLDPAPPTRLFIDAGSTAAWRELGFFPVTEGQDGDPALLMRLLQLKQAHPLAPGQSLPDGLEVGIRRHNTCAAPAEAKAFAEQHPQLGMPFALPGLPQDELALIQAWLNQGAAAESSSAVPTAGENQQISRWESWLNGAGPERALVARWLFEHWAFARLYFDGGESGHFFRLVRSATPPGKAVAEIATRRPNDDPGQAFFYRFRQQQGTRVYKTHITFPLHDALLQRIEQLFFGSEWRLTKTPGYSDQERSNPFTTFAAIPPAARYRFMLEHAEYFVRSFIRGPVCRGQLATDVIRDHFWVMFQAPQQDPYIADAGFRKAADPLLDLPSLEDNLLAGAETWISSTEDRNRYQALRQAALARRHPAGPGIASIWDGDGINRNALLTVFRHHDSASVKQGWLGQQPITIWLMDYPLLERSYYNLVVNFDVFGNLAHQAQTRLYFDLIRNGAEQNSLRLLPADSRQGILDRWYQGSGKIKLWMSYQAIDTEQPSRLDLPAQRPFSELLNRLLRRFSDLNATPDPINRPVCGFANQADAQLSGLSGIPAAEMPAIGYLPDASILRLTHDDGTRGIYTLIRNRRHSNVAFVLGESLRYQQEKDEISIVPGVATGYPNFIFQVPSEELPLFVKTLRDKTLKDRERFVQAVIARWGVLRSNASFWQQFHDINRFLVETDPVEAGILDLNRYVDFPLREKP